MPTKGRGFYLNVLRPQRGGVYARLAQSYWDHGHVKTRVLINFGKVDEDQIRALRVWIAANPALRRNPAIILSSTGALHCKRSWAYGREALAHFLWWKLGLHQIVIEALNGVPGKAQVERWVETMVINRLSDPASKHGILEWLNHSATPSLLGFGDVPRYDNALYRAMDLLRARQDTLEARVYERLVGPLTTNPGVLYHDLTSTYCEGRDDDFITFGYPRDRVEGAPQVNWGMIVTPEGLPITVQVYPGNTKDETTVTGMRERLEKVFGLHGGIYVGDRGMRTKDNLKDLVKHGFHYVLAEKNSTKVAQEVLTLAQQVKPVKVSESNVAREVVTADGVRHVVLLNERRRQSELEVLKERQEEGKVILTRWRRHAGKMHHHEILKGAQSELRKAGLQALFDLGFDEDSFQGLTSEWKDKVRRTQEWAGWWVLATDTELSVEEVTRLYQGLAIIERGWKEIKSVLEVRPLHHRLRRRIESHLVICSLAFLLERYVELKVREAKLEQEGRPLTGPAAMKQFESLVVNRQEIAGTGVRFNQFTELDARQTAIVWAVGLKPEQFAKGWTGLDPAEIEG
jgi:transposase